MIKVYVIHVKGAKTREKHIRKEMQRFNIDFEFVLDGNKESITPLQLNTYFAGEMHEISARTSCAIKHIFAYEKMVKNNDEQALIFEDDIVLKKQFNTVLPAILNEIKTKNLSNYIISLENSGHNYVKKREIIAGQYLYQKDKGRCAGAYIIDKKGASNLLQKLYTEKCDLPIDWFHNKTIKEKQIQSLWAHPYLAEQGSHNGKIKSLLDDKKYGWFKRFVYFFQRIFRPLNG